MCVCKGQRVYVYVCVRERKGGSLLKDAAENHTLPWHGAQTSSIITDLSLQTGYIIQQMRMNTPFISPLRHSVYYDDRQPHLGQNLQGGVHCTVFPLLCKTHMLL